jgi:hypothetical protein
MAFQRIVVPSFLGQPVQEKSHFTCTLCSQNVVGCNYVIMCRLWHEKCLNLTQTYVQKTVMNWGPQIPRTQESPPNLRCQKGDLKQANCSDQTQWIYASEPSSYFSWCCDGTKQDSIKKTPVCMETEFNILRTTHVASIIHDPVRL